MNDNIKLYQGDCLDVMGGNIPDKSVDMILCDLPYGTTQCSWDTIIPFEPLWEQYKRVIKDNGAIVLFGSEPFTSKLVCSQIDLFRYDLVWDKRRGSDFLNANRKPLDCHENILVFYKKSPTYNPQYTFALPYKGNARTARARVYGCVYVEATDNQDGHRHPLSILSFARDGSRLRSTQKPVALLEWLIRTYTNEGEVVLDNCMGSGSTGVACIGTNRKFIGIEKDEKIFDIAKKRIEEQTFFLS